MRINHNITAMNTYRQFNLNAENTSKSMAKLSSGYRINKAADDAAGLSISEKMRSQIRGLTQGNRNLQDGISFIQTAEGALTEVSDMLTRMKELTVQVQTGTYSDDDAANVGAELQSLGKAITDIYTNTKFNGTGVFGASSTGGVATAKTASEVKDALVTAAGKGMYVQYDGTTWQSKANSSDGWTNLASAPAFTASDIGLSSNQTYFINSAGEIEVGGPDGATVSVKGYALTAEEVTAELVAKAGNTAGNKIMYNAELEKWQTQTASGTTWTSVEVAFKPEDVGLDPSEVYTLAGSPITIQKGNPGTNVTPSTYHAGKDNDALVSNAGKEKVVDIAYGDDGSQRMTILSAKTGELAKLTALTSAANMDAEGARAVSVETVEDAITEVNAVRATYGAQQNQLEHMYNNMSATKENLQAAESRVRDVDMAEEMMEYTKSNIVQQAAQAMLAQANQQPQGVLQLLQ